VTSIRSRVQGHTFRSEEENIIRRLKSNSSVQFAVCLSDIAPVCSHLICSDRTMSNAADSQLSLHEDPRARVPHQELSKRTHAYANGATAPLTVNDGSLRVQHTSTIQAWVSFPAVTGQLSANRERATLHSSDPITEPVFEHLFSPVGLGSAASAAAVAKRRLVMESPVVSADGAQAPLNDRAASFASKPLGTYADKPSVNVNRLSSPLHSSLKPLNTSDGSHPSSVEVADSEHPGPSSPVVAQLALLSAQLERNKWLFEGAPSSSQTGATYAVLMCAECCCRRDSSIACVCMCMYVCMSVRVYRSSYRTLMYQLSLLLATTKGLDKLAKLSQYMGQLAKTSCRDLGLIASAKTAWRFEKVHVA